MSVSQAELDAIDLQLLERLQTDASLSNQALAELVHVSPPTCLRRQLKNYGFPGAWSVTGNCPDRMSM